MTAPVPLNLDDPVSPEMNLYLFYKEIATQVTPLEREILEQLVKAATSRGWFPTIESVAAQVAEHADATKVDHAVVDLQRRRLLYLEPDGKIASIIGGITHQKTRFRAMTDEHVPFHLLGALDCLTAARTLQRPVSIDSVCGVTGEPITFEVDKEGSIIKSSPNTFTAFIAGWDGLSSIPDTVGPSSHFFLDDEKLQQWQSANGDPDGMPLSEDIIRSVGMEMADTLADLYVQMSIH